MRPPLRPLKEKNPGGRATAGASRIIEIAGSHHKKIIAAVQANLQSPDRDAGRAERLKLPRNPLSFLASIETLKRKKDL